MKQIIIILLVIILGVIGYNFYRSWQRFHPPNYEYMISESIDGNHPDKALLLDYHEAVQQLNGYTITQWSVNSVDVRNPGDDDAITMAAASTYNKHLANVKWYEAQLIATLQETEVEELITTPNEVAERNFLTQQLYNNRGYNNDLRLGEKSALVFEVQRLLIAKGEIIQHDGLFRAETFNALQRFETKKGLLADGKLDALTLSYLLK